MRPVPGPGRRRRGFTLLELSAAAFVVVAAMTLMVTTVAWAAAEGRRVERRQVASREVANAMERIAARPWEKLAGGDIELSPEARSALPDGVFKVSIAEETAGLKRIRVELLWRDGAGRDQPRSAVRLTAWRARPDGGRR